LPKPECCLQSTKAPANNDDPMGGLRYHRAGRRGDGAWEYLVERIMGPGFSPSIGASSLDRAIS
jgi:hypothetical protein